MGERKDGGSDHSLLRIFIAVDMPHAVKQKVRDIQAALKEKDLFAGKYVNPDDAHVTLQFIGFIEPVALRPIKKILGSVPFEPFDAKTGIVGHFGSNGFVKVIWLEVLGDGIVDLAHRIEKGLSLGTATIHRPFQAHVTVARVKEAADPHALKDEINSIQVEPVSFDVHDFKLKQSVLTPNGHVYVDLKTYPEKK